MSTDVFISCSTRDKQVGEAICEALSANGVSYWSPLDLKAGDKACDKAAEDLVQNLKIAGLDVLYDDTEGRAGAKFTNMDLIGLPTQVVIGPRGLKQGVVEIKDRGTGNRFELSPEAALSYLSG